MPSHSDIRSCILKPSVHFSNTSMMVMILLKLLKNYIWAHHDSQEGVSIFGLELFFRKEKLFRSRNSQWKMRAGTLKLRIESRKQS